MTLRQRREQRAFWVEEKKRERERERIPSGSHEWQKETLDTHWTQKGARKAREDSKQVFLLAFLFLVALYSRLMDGATTSDLING